MKLTIEQFEQVFPGLHFTLGRDPGGWRCKVGTGWVPGKTAEEALGAMVQSEILQHRDVINKGARAKAELDALLGKLTELGIKP